MCGIRWIHASYFECESNRPNRSVGDIDRLPMFYEIATWERTLSSNGEYDKNVFRPPTTTVFNSVHDAPRMILSLWPTFEPRGPSLD